MRHVSEVAHDDNQHSACWLFEVAESFWHNDIFFFTRTLSIILLVGNFLFGFFLSVGHANILVQYCDVIRLGVFRTRDFSFCFGLYGSDDSFIIIIKVVVVVVIFGGLLFDFDNLFFRLASGFGGAVWVDTKSSLFLALIPRSSGVGVSVVGGCFFIPLSEDISKARLLLDD